MEQETATGCTRKIRETTNDDVWFELREKLPPRQAESDSITETYFFVARTLPNGKDTNW